MDIWIEKYYLFVDSDNNARQEFRYTEKHFHWPRHIVVLAVNKCACRVKTHSATTKYNWNVTNLWQMTTANPSNEQTIFEQIPVAVVAPDAKAICEMEATTKPLILSNLHIPFVLLITQHDDDMMTFELCFFNTLNNKSKELISLRGLLAQLKYFHNIQIAAVSSKQWKKNYHFFCFLNSFDATRVSYSMKTSSMAWK